MFSYTQHSQEWLILRTAMAKNNNPLLQLKELSLMQKQIELMQDINQQLKNRPYFINNQTNSTFHHKRSNNQNGLSKFQNSSQIVSCWNATPTQFRNLRSLNNNSSACVSQEEYQQEEIAKALADVKQHCSQVTYHSLQNKMFQCLNNRQHQLTKLLKRQISVNKQLKEKLLILSQQNQTMRKELQKAYMSIQLHDGDREKLKKQSQQLFLKQKALILSETKIFEKQKNLIDLKKRLDSQHKQMNNQRKVIDEMLVQIQDRIYQLEENDDNNENKNHQGNIGSDRSSKHLEKIQNESKNLLIYYRQILASLRMKDPLSQTNNNNKSQFYSSYSKYSLEDLKRVHSLE